MSTDRCVKWSKDAREFFESAEDGSLVLDIIVSYACASQSGDGLEELVNSLNGEKISKKLSRVNLLDTSYLYRHVIPNFSKYSNPDVPTEWFLKNKHIIEKLNTKVYMKSWVTEVSSEIFPKWYRQIMIDYAGDGNGKGIIQEFRDLVIAEAAVAAYKSNKDLKDCIEFMLEECAHTCANMRSPTNLVYPMKVSRPVVDAAKRYNIHINHLSYRASVQTQNSPDHVSVDLEGINKEVTTFMKEKVSNVNFFVVDKYGNHIYKNYAYDSIVGEINFGRLDPDSWKNSLEVMNNRKQVLIEEKYQGISYLSVKAPLIINDKVEGVIGLAVDITDRKRAEVLERENQMQKIRIHEQKEFKAFTAQVLHDISSPLACLEFIAKSPDIPDSCQGMLKSMASSIRNICGTLQAKYREYEKLSNSSQSANIFPSLVLDEIVKNKKFEYRDSKVKFDFLSKTNDMHISIIADQLGFERMISNLINNAVDACAKDSGVVEISFSLENEWAKIIIKDNGIGMPKEIIEKIKSRSTNFNSTKHSGYGLGLSQILAEISRYKGILDIESKENSGTTFSIKFPVVECPKWIAKQLTFKKGNVVVVLDDDPSVFKILEELFKNYSSDNDLTLRFFTKSKDTLDFIKSFPEKEKLFFISDYELRGDDFNGLTVILQSDLAKDRVCVLTGHSDKNLQDMAESSGVKILLKQFLSNVSIVVT